MTAGPHTDRSEPRIVRRTAATVFGVLGVAVGLLLISVAAWLLNEDRDNGFYASQPHLFERNSFAIVSGDFDQLTEAPSWLANLLTDPVDIRVAGSAPDGDQLFVGIAATDDVDRYLSDVNHDEVKGFEIDDRVISSVQYTGRDGTRTPGPPTAQDFWVVATDGEGLQSLVWSLERGSWTAVLMNADGSAGVEAEVGFGARISNIVAIAWTATAFGSFLLLGGAFLVYRARQTTHDGQEAVHH